jgi:protein phosphatase 1G
MDELLLTPEGSKELTRISKNLPSSYPVKEKKLYINKGCTAIVVLIRNNEIFVANAGDSRCILNRNGVAVSLSTDHKPSLVNEKNRILEAGARIIEGRINGGLNLTRSIGDFKYKNIPNLPKDRQSVICEPEIVRVNLEDGDKFLVIGCDGVWERIGSQDCVNIVQEKIDKGFGLGVIAEEVLDRAIAPKVTNGLGCDNMTIIIVAFLCWGTVYIIIFFFGVYGMG